MKRKATASSSSTRWWSPTAARHWRIASISRYISRASRRRRRVPQRSDNWSSRHRAGFAQHYPYLTITSIQEISMSSSVKEMLAAANGSVPTISPQDAKALIERGQALVVDVRDGLEIQSTGKVQGAKHVARGMLEFRADPESPYYDKAFDRDKTVIVYCASGGRSALAGKTLQDMGYKDVRNLGGFKGWADSGGAVEKD